jgi:hypothetical protein
VKTVQPKPPSQVAGVIGTSIFVLLFGGVAALFFSVAINDIENEARIASAPVHARAIVVDVHRVSSGEAGYSYVPTVEFGVLGSPVRVQLDSVAGRTTHQEGDELLVDYQAGHPETAVESSRRGEVSSALILPIFFAAISLAILVIGAINWFAFRRRFRAKQRSASA